jgi:uncharacterized membrane protein YqjE
MEAEMRDMAAAEPVTATPAAPGATSGDRSMVDLVKAIAGDTATLIRKEVELAKQEIQEGIAARVKAVAALAVAGVFGLYLLTFLGFAAAFALANVVALWLAFVIVAGAFLLLAVLALAFARTRMKKPASLAPEKAKETVKEDVQWAKAQLKR